MKKSTSTRKKINPAIKREKNHKPLHKEPAVEECCNNEVDKINQNLVDRISELPDDILVSIISRLTFKEATATSILSTRWRHLYTHIISLDFRFPFKPEKLYLRGYDEEIQEEEFTDCISRINHTLNSYKGGQVLKDFRLLMPCLAGADIEKWLEFALSREVQIIDIHMVYCIKATHESDYTFPLSTLISKNGSQAILPGLKCLKELSLTAVHVKDQDIEILLSYFVALERLSIESPRRTWYIKTLKNVSVVGHRTLKHLNISSSWSVKSIEVRDMINLVSLSFYHLPPIYVLQLDNVPNLVEFTVSDEKRNTLAKILPRISCIHDQLLRLKLCVFRDHIMVRNRIMPRICKFLSREPIYMLPKLINLKHLELDVFMNNKYGTQELFPLIAACPSLEELELKFLWLSEVKYIDRKLNKCRVERKCPSCNLRKVRLSRYSGSTPELEFALYIVNNAVTLQELMIVEACDRTREIRRRAIARACRRNSVSFII